MSDFKYPRVGVGVFIRRDDKILLQLRSRNSRHASGMWSSIGGHLEKWESFEDCILREKNEECGDQLIISNPSFWTVVNTTFLQEDRHYVFLAFIADWIKGEPFIMEPTKCEKYEWFKWNEFPENVMPGIRWIRQNGLNPFDI